MLQHTLITWFFWSNGLTWFGHWSGVSVWHWPRGLASIHLLPCGNQYCSWCFCLSKVGRTGEGKDAFVGMDEPWFSFPQACSRMAFQRRWRRITRAHATCQGLLSGSAWHERHSFSRQETLDMQRWVQQYVNKLGAPIHRLLNVVDISITLSKLNHTLIYKHPQAHRKYQNSIQEAPNGITHTYIYTLTHVRDSFPCSTTYIEYRSHWEDSTIFWGTPPNSICFVGIYSLISKLNPRKRISAKLFGKLT